MKKLIIILVACFMFQGCSFLKIASAPFKNTVSTTPQQINKTQRVVRCDGDIVLDDAGRVIKCTDGFYSKENGYSETQRKLTFWEKIAQLASKTAGWIVWLIIISIVLTFMGLGGLVSAFWTSANSIGTKTLKQVSKAIQKVKDNNPDLISALEASTDDDVKKFLTNFKQQNNIK